MLPLYSILTTTAAEGLAQKAVDYAHALHLQVAGAELSYAEALRLLQVSGPQSAVRETARNQKAGQQLALSHFKALQGVSVRKLTASVRIGQPLPATGAWTAVCDGSYKNFKGSAGVWVADPSFDTRAEIAVPVHPAVSAIEAELRACHLALTTASALGANWLVVLVDAQSVLAALEGKLPLRHSVIEGLLAAAAARFLGVEVRKVSRAWTARADELAAAVHSGLRGPGAFLP